MLDTEQHIMTDQRATSKEQGQEKIPLAQRKALEVPTLHTPLNEEKGKKRDREEGTPINGATKQPRAKRQRINPLSEDEFIEESTGSLRGDNMVSQETSPVIETSTSSHRKDLGKQHSVEVSSTRPQSKQGSNIKRIFTEIKAQNDPLRL